VQKGREFDRVARPLFAQNYYSIFIDNLVYYRLIQYIID
jgi:hypothetical protein